ITVSGIAIVVVGIILTIVCHIMKDHKKELPYHRFFSLLILILTLVHIVFYYIDFRNYQSAINTITVNSVDLSTIEDGDYIGEYDVGYIYAKVKVAIKNHAIAQVELIEHNHERGVNAESIVKTIVEKQTITVDSVSGATNSSLVIKKACENALH
ncbi:MAG: FMN-binding protein, partial [bacterium]|nr:FMN-binding protein [bacterium]